MKEEILNIVAEGDDLAVYLPDQDRAVMVITDIIWQELQKGNDKSLSILFSIVVHTLSRSLNGKMQDEFIANLQKITPQYREAYKKMREQMMKEVS